MSLCADCVDEWRAWLRWLPEQGPVGGWRNYPPANGSERRLARDLECRDRRVTERIDLVKRQMSKIARDCAEPHGAEAA